MLAVTLRAHSRIYSVAHTKWRSAFLVSTKGLRWISLMLALQRVGKGHLTLKEEQLFAMSCICSEIAHHSEPQVQAAAYLGDQEGPALWPG